MRKAPLTRDHGLPERESLRVEFKGERSERLSDHDLALAAVCLANTEGGTLYLGVEDDGRITGMSAGRDAAGVTAAIANNTSPSLSVRVRLLDLCSLRVAEIDREADLGLLDLSDLPVAGAGPDVLDPLERQRLRRAIERYRGDRSLLVLGDDELDGALGLVRTVDGKRVPTLCGLLLLGREEALRDHLPGHEVAFQVLAGTEVRVNEFFRLPLVRLFERVTEMFEARVTERELQVGMFRVPVPTLDHRAFREGLVNALTHRDYSRLGAVHVQWRDESLTISNPGGFVEGVRSDNLLTVDPHPRNPRLADAFKRIGLAERTGRGVDLLYHGLLRFGRPAPDYSRSDAHHVVVELSCAEADLAFFQLVLDEEKQRGQSLPLESLLVLSHLRSVRRAEMGELAGVLQREPSAARKIVAALVEGDLVSAHGIKKGRTYTLAPKVYRRFGRRADYVRQAGFDAVQQAQMVVRYVEEHGSIRRADAIELCRLGQDQAYRLLRRLTQAGVLVREGSGKGARYLRGRSKL